MEIKGLIESINKDLNSKTACRLGTLFNTENNKYFYDTGTGKIIEIDDKAEYILKSILNSSIDSIDKIEVTDEYLTYFLEFVIKENLLQAVKPNHFSHQRHSKKYLYNILNNEMEQLILKVTGRCNFRCEYCIYNDKYDLNTNFISEDMSLEVAKKAVDFYYEHSSNSKYTAITFYGGEPLLRFNFIRDIIDYSMDKFKNRSNILSFSLTSNLSLLTQEMIDYFISIPHFSLVCSLDGDCKSQDSYRKYANGEKTFDTVFEKFKLLCDTLKRNRNDSFSLSVNMVFTPPYSFEKLDRVNEFYSKLDFLPENFSIMITYPTEGTLNDNGFLQKLKTDERYKKFYIKNLDLVYTDPLQQWAEDKVIENQGLNKKDSNNLFFNYIKDQLVRINTRYISDEITENYPFNGCCLPGMRRLYVDTKGDFYPCERVGKTPKIGNISYGLDYNSIYDYYIDGYEKHSISYCQNCWAIRLCGVCYAVNMLEDGVDRDYHRNKCDLNRLRLRNQLAFYHSGIEKKLDLSILENEFLY